MVEISVVYEQDLTQRQIHGYELLHDQCFSHVDPKEVKECFFAESFCRLFAHEGEELVGTLRLYKRNVVFNKKEFLLGGLAGACVPVPYRRLGIGSKLMLHGLEVLRTEGVDVACLNADLSRGSDKFYESLGFTLMERPISFTDVHGCLRYDTGTMFIPVSSESVYNMIMKSEETFHYGRGYW